MSKRSLTGDRPRDRFGRGDIALPVRQEVMDEAEDALSEEYT